MLERLGGASGVGEFVLLTACVTTACIVSAVTGGKLLSDWAMFVFANALDVTEARFCTWSAGML